MIKLLKTYSGLAILYTSVIISIFAFLYFSSQNMAHLGYGDAMSRLNIARKIIDNLNPGLAQFGDIWLPLPQMLMLPFVSINKLWHTGVAGYIMSGTAFVLLIYYLFAIGKEAFGKIRYGVLMACLGLCSINLLYMQTTAMSEILFLTTLIGSTYYLFKWAKYNSKSSLLISGVFISASTLTRYEGYFVFLFAVLLVFIIAFLKTKKYSATEGTVFIFSTLAITGIIFWMVYSWVIFGDPLYWKGIYAHEKSVISTQTRDQATIVDSGTEVYQKNNIVLSVYSFWNASAQMNGIIITSLATGATVFFITYLLWRNKWMDNPEYLVFLLPSTAGLFVVFTLFRGNIPLFLPELTIQNLTNKNTSLMNEYNIRYGLNLFPFIAIMLGFIASRSKYLLMLVVVVLLVQIYTTFWTQYFTVYQLPMKLSSVSESRTGKTEASVWLKNNYDGGLIMISALKHDPEMFYLGIDYKDFIHEGAGKYWLDSRKDPQKYATWIFMSKYYKSNDDSVTKFIAKNQNLNKFFNLVYDDGSFQIYKIKTKPEVQI